MFMLETAICDCIWLDLDSNVHILHGAAVLLFRLTPSPLLSPCSLGQISATPSLKDRFRHATTCSFYLLLFRP